MTKLHFVVAFTILSTELYFVHGMDLLITVFNFVPLAPSTEYQLWVY